MNILYLMIPVALLLGGGFLIAFIWGASKGQYDDLETPAHRILLEEACPQTTKQSGTTTRS